jgi:hypothetical protein
MINEASKRKVKGRTLWKDARKDARPVPRPVAATAWAAGRRVLRPGHSMGAIRDWYKSSRSWKPKTNVVLRGSPAMRSGNRPGMAGAGAGPAGFGGVPVDEVA